MSTPETNSNQSNEPTDPRTSQQQREAGGSAGNDNQVGGQSSNSEQGKSSSNTSTTTTLLANPETLPTVDVNVDQRPIVKEPSLPIIGFNLASFVLFIISGFILFLAVYLSAGKFEASSLIQIPTQTNISDSTYVRKIELIRMIQEEKKGYREFTVQMSQMILLNLLLPVLTAILGYIFASNKNSTTA